MPDRRGARDATTGKVAHKLAVPKAPERITLSPEGLVLAHLHDEPEPRAFRVVPGKTPKLAPAGPDSQFT